MHTTNYVNTFIQVADDCPTATAEIPPQKGAEKTAANLQFEILMESPYVYTSDDVLFGVYAQRQGVSGQALEAAREQFFAKGQPCFRSSPLTKRYGWGVHSDAEGKIALYPMESEAYERLSRDPAIKQVKAMRSKRA
ncbi:MAG: DUF6157 family protein [Bacteroidia bacterium]|nr:DUF6157 family protein [Bacteroidia bacterium]